MTDKSWMLDRQAIQCAKTCVKLIRDEHNEKLSMADPDFMQRLVHFVQLSQSTLLMDAYNKLCTFLDDTSLAKLKKQQSQTTKAILGSNPSGEMINYRNKNYPRWKDGREFKGLYRGQPTYK